MSQERHHLRVKRIKPKHENEGKTFGIVCCPVTLLLTMASSLGTTARYWCPLPAHRALQATATLVLFGSLGKRIWTI